jgi:hypothetical protein
MISLRSNKGEIELSVLARQGLAHNIATIEELCQQVQSWQDHRNQRAGTVNWQFRTADARTQTQAALSRSITCWSAFGDYYVTE